MKPETDSISERRETEIRSLIRRYNGEWISNNFDFWVCTRDEFESVKSDMIKEGVLRC